MNVNALTPEQRKVASAILGIARKRGESRTEVLSALSTGIVESGLRNLNRGDKDSKGWRQERASLYKDPTNLEASINRFFNETSGYLKKHGNTRPGALAAAVQRPAARYRGRYAQHTKDAAALIRELGDGLADSSAPPASRPSTLLASATSSDGFDARGFAQAQRRTTIGKLIERMSPGSPLLRTGLFGTETPDPTKFVTPGIPTTSTPTGSSTPAKQPMGDDQAVGYMKRIIERASSIDKRAFPYVWGGGHSRTGVPDRGTGRDPGIGYDCSGAVSAVLGVDPRVSGLFARWGKPGRGKRVTIYANVTHVLMEIDGKFWGTSASNPKGGAGWIDASKISNGYLSRFTARHPVGL